MRTPQHLNREIPSRSILLQEQITTHRWLPDQTSPKVRLRRVVWALSGVKLGRPVMDAVDRMDAMAVDRGSTNAAGKTIKVGEEGKNVLTRRLALQVTREHVILRP